MSKKIVSFICAFSYVLLFFLSTLISAVLFMVAGRPEFAAVGTAFIGIGALYCVKRLRRKDAQDSFSLKPITPKEAALIAAITIPVTLLVQCARFVLPREYLDAAQTPETPYGLLSLMTIVITTPIAEEAYFRGAILRELGKEFAPATAIIVSSAMFAILHSGVAWTFTAFLISLFYSVLFLKYNSIFASVTAHITSNAIAVAFNLLSQQ